MTIRPNQRRHLTVLLVVLCAACNDGPTMPQNGTIRVSVKTSGGDLDIDGYQVFVDSTMRRSFFVNDAGDISNVGAGAHSVTLKSVAENCTVSGALPRSVTVTAGQITNVAFEITCVATAITITTHVTGSDIDNAYQVVVNDAPSVLVAANSSVAVSRLAPGKYRIKLDPLGGNCSVASGNQITVDVVSHTTTPVLFEISCVPPTRVEKIAFAADTMSGNSLQTWIWLVNVDGSGAVKLTAGTSPSWTPDGTRLVFSNAHCSSDFYYYYVTCSGGVIVMDPETRNVTAMSGSNGGFSPAWAPTNDAIAFLHCCDNSGQASSLFVLTVGEPTATQRPLSGFLPAYHPTWSPDGRRIAFSCIVATSNYDLCIIERDGTGLVRLTSDGAADTGPAWSPDGKRIAFTRNGSDIDVITLDDRVVSRVTDGSGPAWSRDGTKLVFAGRDGLFTINVDGSNRTRLTSGPHYAPAWRP
jgi:Tol biopolymer transport system component